MPGKETEIPYRRFPYLVLLFTRLRKPRPAGGPREPAHERKLRRGIGKSFWRIRRFTGHGDERLQR